jgi:hypothetical protein
MASKIEANMLLGTSKTKDYPKGATEDRLKYPTTSLSSDRGTQ